MEALRRSLDSVSTTKKKSAKADLQVKAPKAKARPQSLKKVASR
jgi:hypothetical protein